MYACVYFQKDGTLSIVHENDKDIKVLTTFEKREPVEMKWRKPGKQAEVFNGVIVSVGGKFVLSFTCMSVMWLIPPTD